MEKSNKIYQAYVEILKRELVPAMGCTEPIAIAYCAAKAREALGALPDKITVAASGNIIKNVKSVIVPNTEGRKGIEAAAAIGVLAGDASAELEVIARVKPEDKAQLSQYMEATDIQVEAAQSEHVLDIIVTVSKGTDTAQVQVVNEHTNIVKICKNDQIILEKEIVDTAEPGKPDYECMTIEDIYDFAMTCDLADVQALLDRQIAYNTAISDEGLKNDYGANIGKTLLKAYGNDIHIRARARAAAGSDARMNGCEMPVVINSGSGNQGMTVSLPVIEYAKELGSSQEELYRALLLSNLVTLHEKEGIGRLSALCGIVNATIGVSAGITYLHGGSFDQMCYAIKNMINTLAGMVCDGAKPSCALKMSTGLYSAFVCAELALHNHVVDACDGLSEKDTDFSIRNLGRLGQEGMEQTDDVVLDIMTHKAF